MARSWEGGRALSTLVGYGFLKYGSLSLPLRIFTSRLERGPSSRLFSDYYCCYEHKMNTDKMDAKQVARVPTGEGFSLRHFYEVRGPCCSGAGNSL